MNHSDSKLVRMCSLLNRKRKTVVTGMQESVDSNPGPSSESADGVEGVSECEKLKKEAEKKKAREAILREAYRAKQRAEMVGPQGWLRPKCLNTNKRFLHRTLAATLPKTRPKRKKSPKDT